VAYALVAHSTIAGTNGGTSGAIDTSGANLLIFGLAYVNAGSVAASDSKSNTWADLTDPGPSSPQGRISYAKNATTGASHTGTGTGSGVFLGACFAAFSGADTASPFDQQSTGLGAGLTSLQAGSILPGSDNQLIIATLSGFGQSSIAIDSGFTIIDTVVSSGGTNYGCATAYKIQTTAIAVNPTWSWTGSTAATAEIASFKAGAAASFPPELFLRPTDARLNTLLRM
jgi:hypothetical protein